MRTRLVLSVFLLATVTLLVSCFNSPPLTVTASQQLINDTTAIENYLNTNFISHYKDASGIRFVIISLGTGGFPPRLDNEIKVTYTGNLLTNPNGAPFDSGQVDGVLSTYITGWQIGLTLFPKGTHARLYIPSGYAYGTQAVGAVPANANLIFDIQLTDVITTAAETTQLTADVATIDSYLSSNSITAVKDSTGLRYRINTLGTGATPTWLSKVSMSYSGKFLPSGDTFYNATVVPSAIFDSRVVNYIRAFQVGLQKMPVGTTATLYVPSGLAFGSNGSSDGSVPGNSNLIYEITLSAVTN